MEGKWIFNKEGIERGESWIQKQYHIIKQLVIIRDNKIKVRLYSLSKNDINTEVAVIGEVLQNSYCVFTAITGYSGCGFRCRKVGGGVTKNTHKDNAT